MSKSEHIFTVVIEKNEEDIKRLGLLSEAFTSATPPSDSALTRLVFIGYNSAEPRTGAARALVLTGDLHLLRDDSVRSAIIHFVGMSEGYADRSRRIEWEWIHPSFQPFYSAMRPTAQGGHPFSVRIADLLDDPEFYDVVQDLALAYENYVRMQQGMLREIREAQTYVEKALRE